MHLNFWASLRDAFLKIDDQVLLVDSTCSLYIDSLDSSECMEVRDTNCTECMGVEAGTVGTEASGSNVEGAIAGSLLGGTVLGSLLATAVLIGVYFCWLRKNHGRSKQEKELEREAVMAPTRYTKPAQSQDNAGYELVGWAVRGTGSTESTKRKPSSIETEATLKPSDDKGYVNLPVETSGQKTPVTSKTITGLPSVSSSKSHSPHPQSSGCVVTHAPEVTRQVNPQLTAVRISSEVDDDGYEDPLIFLNANSTEEGKASAMDVVAAEVATQASTAATHSSPPSGRKMVPLAASAFSLASHQFQPHPLLPQYPTKSSDKRSKDESSRIKQAKTTKHKRSVTSEAIFVTKEVSTGVSTGNKPTAAPPSTLPSDLRTVKKM